MTIKFLSTPSARRATRIAADVLCFATFLSTPSARRATQYNKGGPHNMENFYPRPPRGGRRIPVPTKLSQLEFLSTPSARRATASSGRPAKTTAYFYPRPPRGGRHQHADDRLRGVAISIHALREEGDIEAYIKPLGLRLFLSTPSARRATRPDWRLNHEDSISIHALREEGDVKHFRGDFGFRVISIHALREEGDK